MADSIAFGGLTFARGGKAYGRRFDPNALIYPDPVGSTSSRFVDPNWLFEVDFSLLSDGSHPAATFTSETAAQLTNRGLSFARATPATVQTGLNTINTSIPINAARVGSADGIKRGLVIEPSRVNGLISNVRTINFFDSVPSDTDITHYSQPVTIGGGPGLSLNAAVGPDGQAKATTVGSFTGGSIYPIYNAPSSGIYTRPYFGPFFQINSFINIPLNVSVWMNGSARMTWAPRNPWDANAYTVSPLELSTSTSGWRRVSLAKDSAAASRVFFCLLNGADLTSQGGTGASGAIGGSFDLIQMEQDRWSAEVITNSDGFLSGDHVTYAYGSELASQNGRMSAYFSFFPKHDSSDNVSYSTNVASNSSCSSFTLWSSGSGTTRAYAEIVQNDGVHTPYKLVLHDVENHTTVTSESMSWSANDFVELFIQCGANQPTNINWRKRTNQNDATPSWTTMTPVPALVTIAPSGSVNFYWNGLDDIRSFACRAVEIRTYLSGTSPA